jgi:hypothetical protein
MHAALIAKSIEFYQDEESQVGFVTASIDSIDKHDKGFQSKATRGRFQKRKRTPIGVRLEILNAT